MSTPLPNLTYQLSLYKSKKILVSGGNLFALKIIREEFDNIAENVRIQYMKAYICVKVTRLERRVRNQTSSL